MLCLHTLSPENKIMSFLHFSWWDREKITRGRVLNSLNHNIRRKLLFERLRIENTFLWQFPNNSQSFTSDLIQNKSNWALKQFFHHNFKTQKDHYLYRLGQIYLVHFCNYCMFNFWNIVCEILIYITLVVMIRVAKC